MVTWIEDMLEGWILVLKAISHLRQLLKILLYVGYKLVYIFLAVLLSSYLF